MNIGLDYDETYAADPLLWDMFIALVAQRGHGIFIVTARHEHEPVIHEFDIPVYYTGRQAKHHYMMQAHKILIHVWIDDLPQFIHKSHGELLEW